MPSTLRKLDRSSPVPRKTIARQREILARLEQQYEAVDKQIFRVENGIETMENLSLGALKLHRSGLLENLQYCRALA
ncbi:MAG TPA: hypothetical protein VLC30_00670 [Pseudomonas sp.]|nr:hypothetical protein [Pseudomonas sp.]